MSNKLITNTEDGNELDTILLSWFIEENDDEDFKSTDFFHDMKNDIEGYIQSNYILKSDVEGMLANADPMISDEELAELRKTEDL